MKIIVINSIKYGTQQVFVDDKDYSYLRRFNWFIQKGGRTLYAVRNVKRCEIISMHRDIMKPDTHKNRVDHIDHNGLNNQRNNLRTCTHQQNTSNGRSRINTTSSFLGVSKNLQRYSVSWVSVIHPKGIKIHLGSFPYTSDGEIMAAKAYDEAAKKHFGEFANLNFPL